MRNGECAVVEFRTGAGTSYPWIGYIEGDKKIREWCDDGRWKSGIDHPFDLIEPWTDKPVVNWSAMPAWAKWVAMDEFGNWFHYDKKPEKCSSSYIGTNAQGYIPEEFAPSFTGNWRDSLVERPAGTKPKA